MTMHRIVLATAALLLGATPLAEAGSRHVDISLNLGYYLPVHMGYVEQVAPVVVYPPAPAIYYQPVYAQPGHHYYRDHDRYDRHERWHHREKHRRQHDRDDD